MQPGKPPRDGQGATPATVARTRETLARLESLPAPPAVAARVLDWVTQSDPSLADLCLIVSSDPSLSLKIMKLASAKMHGLQVQNLKIERAASMLGVVTLKQALLGIVIRDTLIKGRRHDDPHLVQLWLHCLASALATQLLAEKLAPKLAEQAFSCGMAHDCGKLALLSALGERYERLLDSAALSGKPLHVLEGEEFGLDHAEAGKWITQSWALPKVFVDVAWLHHQPEEVLSDMDEHGGLLHLVALGNILAHEVLAEPLDGPALARRRFLLERMDLSFHQVEKLKEAVGQRLAERRELFSLDEEDAVATFCVALQRAGRLLSRLNAELEAGRGDAEQASRLLGAVAGAARGLGRAAGAREAFALAADVLSGDFAIPSGCVLALDAQDTMLRGLAWSGAERADFAFPYAEGAEGAEGDSAQGNAPGRLDMPPAEELHPVLRPLAKAIAAHPERLPDSSETAPAFAPSWSRPWRIHPLALDRALLGEVILGPRREGELPNPAEAQGLEQLCGMLAAALERQDAATRLEARTERLGAAMRKMQQLNQKLIQTERLAAVGQLAAGAAHEINNPLAIIYARLQILGLKEPNENLRTAFRQMEEQIGRISSILTQLMDFARPTQPQFSAVDVGALLQNSLSMMSGSFEKRGIAVQAELRPGLPPVWADAKLLEQVFVNLLLNAEQAMEGAPGTLRVRTAWTEGQRHATVEVEDSGAGIAPEHIASIFDPFFTTKEGKGTGLGLSTSYSIVKSHQGDLRVSSAPDKGACFRVLLPLAPEASARPGAKPAKGAHRRAGGDILVVDDESHIQDLLREALEMHGYTVATCGSGEEALALLRKRAFHLALLDIRMPERSGLWLLSELRRAAVKMPVLVITGLATPEEREQALHLGAVRCIQKPFKVDELLEAVDATLRPEKDK